jgi:hypothetical protein
MENPDRCIQVEYEERKKAVKKPEPEATAIASDCTAMSVGSAFDAYVKSYMHQMIFGNNHPKAAIYELRTLFEAQVEEHNREFAWEAGKHVFDRYKDCGALADIMQEISHAASEPLFEVDVAGVIEGTITTAGRAAVKSGVPLFGKPDVFFMNAEGAHVVFDWKVNGYCSKSAVSPAPGYKRIRDTWDWREGELSRNNGDAHKDYIPHQHKGVEINGFCYLEQVNQDWGMQLATYGWLHGERVGLEILAYIDQIVCDNREAKWIGHVDSKGQMILRPRLRVASHRNRVSEAFQKVVMNNYLELWDRIQSGHFFREMTPEESEAQCRNLDEMSENLFCNPATENEAWLARVMRG